MPAKEVDRSMEYLHVPSASKIAQAWTRYEAHKNVPLMLIGVLNC